MAEISTGSAASQLGIDESQVRRLIRDGKLKGRKLGHDWLVEEDSVEAYRNSRRKPGPVPVRFPKDDPVEDAAARAEEQTSPHKLLIDADSMAMFSKTLWDLYRSGVKITLKLPSDHNMPDEIRAAAERFGFEVEEKEGGAYD